MAVVILGIIDIFKPLLQLSVLTNLERRQQPYEGAQRVAIVGIDAQHLCCLQRLRGYIIDNLVVHRGTGHDRGVTAGLACRPMLWRH